MHDYSDLKFQALSLCQRSNAILELIAENELLSRENKELRDKVEHLECMTECHKIAKEDGRDALNDPGDLAPAHLVDFEMTHMDQALAGKRFTMPEGITRKEFRGWMLQNARSLSGGIRLTLELERLDAENEALRALPMIVVKEYTELAFAAKGMKTSDRYIQKANGAMDVHQRMQEVKA